MQNTEQKQANTRKQQSTIKTTQEIKLLKKALNGHNIIHIINNVMIIIVFDLLYTCVLYEGQSIFFVSVFDFLCMSQVCL